MAPRNNPGPNDPDNPNATRNGGGRSNGSTPTAPGPIGSNRPGGPGYAPKPGLQSGESAEDYDVWLYTYAPYIQSIQGANPGREDEVVDLLWTFRNDTNGNLAKEWAMRGLNYLPDTSGGGRTRGGGGGGGGVTKAQQYQQAFAAIKNQAAQLGLELDDAGITSLARVVVDANWSDDMVMDYLAPGATNTTKPGMITDNVDTIKRLAADQLLNVSDASAREWATKIASGEMTFEAVRSLMAQQATIRYGWAASQISQGITVRDMMLPSRDKLASELEMSAEEIDLMDGTWLGMLQTTGEDGTVRAATDSEIAQRARQDARWQNTKAAKTAVTNMSAMLQRTFGF